MDKMVSVIVPIYNVEQFLRKCVDSILAQSYKNLEIILVDDGSPDGCGEICDTYVKLDSRIKVIHKKNGGLSDARNAGLDAATGDLIAFVDSDDWVEADYIQSLCNNMKKYNSDISICGFYRVSGENKIKRLCKEEGQEIVFEGREALKKLLLDKDCPNYAWNKLYKKEAFEVMRFPKGKIWEDIYIMADLFFKTSKISFVHKPLYNYVCREDSIVGKAKMKDYIDFFEVMMHRYNTLKFDQEILPYLQCGLVTGYRFELYHCNLKTIDLTNYNIIMGHRKKIKSLVDVWQVKKLLTRKQILMYVLGVKMPKLAIRLYEYQRSHCQ